MNNLVELYVQLGLDEIEPTVKRADSISLNDVFTKTNFDLLRLSGVTTVREVIERHVRDTVYHGLKTRWGTVHEQVHKGLLRVSDWSVLDIKTTGNRRKTGTDAIVWRPGIYYLLNVKSSSVYGNGSEHEGLPALMAQFRQSSFMVDGRPLKDIPNVELVVGSVSTEHTDISDYEGIPLHHVFGQSFLELFKIDPELACFDMEEIFQKIEESIGEYSFYNRVENSIKKATDRLFRELLDNNGMFRGQMVIQDHDHIDINAVRIALLGSVPTRKHKKGKVADDLFSYID